MVRRGFFTRLAAIPLLAFSAEAQPSSAGKLKIMIKSAWGSDDPTKAGFPFKTRLGPGRGWPSSANIPSR